MADFEAECNNCHSEEDVRYDDILGTSLCNDCRREQEDIRQREYWLSLSPAEREAAIRQAMR